MATLCLNTERSGKIFYIRVHIKFRFEIPNYCCSVSLLCSTVQYFTNNGSTISIASLDMSKAFDKVNHYALFLKLMERHVPYLCFSLICFLTGTRMCLSLWGGTSLCQNWSAYTTGVRQVGGGYCPLHCLLYTLMTLSLVHGCEIAVKCVGILMYAGDLLLISATCNGLSQLIEICEQEMAWLDMQFNARDTTVSGSEFQHVVTRSLKKMHAHCECFDAYRAWIYAHVWPDKD